MYGEAPIFEAFYESIHNYSFMKKLLPLFFAVALAFGANAQATHVELDVFMEHDGVYVNTDGTEVDLTGFTTYRLYAVLTAENDFLSSVYGLAGEPMEINTTTSFWQSTFGANIGANVNPAFYAAVPSLEFDSWLTIGRESTAAPGADITPAQSSNEPWLDNFAAGQNIEMSGIIGGAWFTLFQVSAVNGYPDADGRVLIGQFTTDGEMDGYVNIQVFGEGSQSNDLRAVGLPFSSDPNAVFGCTEEGADNYDPAATSNDGSCIFPCTLTLESLNLTPTTCSNTNNGSAQMVISGQQGSVSYSLNGGNPIALGTFNNLGAGPHTIIISDSQGCLVEEEFTVPVPDPVTVDLSVESGISCNGAGDAVLAINSQGGTGAITLSLTPEFEEEYSGDTITDLGPGTYTVYAVDENGCSGQSNSVSITQPLNINVGITAQVAASCANSEDGIIVVLGTGGAGGLQFSVDNENFQTSNIFNVGPGSYTIYAQDVNGCSGQSNNQAVIGGPEEITFDATVTSPSCFGDSDASLSGMAGGGAGNFSYSVDGGEASNMLDLADLAAGMYTITVVDGNDCTSDFEVEIVAPEAVSVSGMSTDVLCNGDENGSIEAMAEGGTGAFTYTIADGVENNDGMFGDLADGSYTVTAVDENGCEASADFTIEMPDALSIDGSATEESEAGAEDATVSVTVEGGVEPYTFEWSGPNGFSSSDENLDGVSEGTYEVVVTDANGCEITFSTEVVVGIGELGAGISYTLYPNPTNSVIFLNLEGLQGERISYTILDAAGRIIDRVELNAGQSNFRQTIDMTSLASGLYFIQLTAGEYSATERVMKQN